MTAPSPILVATCGNELAGDDGLGSAVHRLLLSKLDGRAQLIDLGINPSCLLDHLADKTLLIIVDAIADPAMARGRIVQFEWSDQTRAVVELQHAVSGHGWSIAEQLALASRLAMLPPRVLIIGAAGTDWRLGEHKDDTIARRVSDRVLEMITDESPVQTRPPRPPSPPRSASDADASPR